MQEKGQESENKMLDLKLKVLTLQEKGHNISRGKGMYLNKVVRLHYYYITLNTFII